MSLAVYPESKQIVIPFRADVEAILRPPAAQRFESGGAWWLAVEHSVQAVRLLRNLGLSAPSPILSYYDWAGGQPFESQRVTADLCTIARRAYVLSEMGVGKTRAVLWAFDYLRRMGLAHKLLVVAPLSTLTTVWENEIFENLHHLRTTVLYGSKRKRVKQLAQDADVYIINHEGVGVLNTELWGRPDLDCIIVDELASYRNNRSDRWKNLQPLVERAVYAWGLTGSPTPNAPTDAYGQCRLLTPENVGWSFKDFKESTMRQIGTFRWVERDEAKEIIHTALQPAVRFTRDECFDLPPTTYSTRSVVLDPAAQVAYKEMYDELATEIRGNEITAANEGVKLSKLLQLSAGFAYDSNGLGHYAGGVDRFRQVFEIIEQTTSKVIVFANFRYMVEMLNAVLSKRYTVGMIHGDVSKAQRDLIFAAFQKDLDPRIIVADPRTMSHGLTLTSAATIVWATPVMSNETYEQANARITRSGQIQNTHIIHLSATKAESQQYARLKRKGSAQGALLELFEGGSSI
jgi:SNF2 family DNA or RNA helicase